MNVFNGCLISKDSVLLTSVIGRDFYERLTVKGGLVVDDVFKAYASSLVRKARYSDVSLISEFQVSPFINRDDWYGSFNDYLVKLRFVLASFNDNSPLISQINGLLDSEVDVDDLDARLVFVSSINSCFSSMGSTSNLSLRAVLFVNERRDDSYDGLSFWFSRGGVDVMSLYQFSLIGGNSFIFDEVIGREVGGVFNRLFNSSFGSGSIKFSDEGFNDYINGKLGSKFYGNDRFGLEPLLYFRSEDKMVLFKKSFGLSEEQVSIITDISMSLNSVESVLFNGLVKPLLSFVYFSDGVSDLLLVQDVKDDSMVGVVYRLVSGGLTVNQVIGDSKALLTDYLINPDKLYNI